jgi:hypothetical protein
MSRRVGSPQAKSSRTKMSDNAHDEKKHGKKESPPITEL